MPRKKEGKEEGKKFEKIGEEAMMKRQRPFSLYLSLLSFRMIYSQSRYTNDNAIYIYL